MLRSRDFTLVVSIFLVFAAALPVAAQRCQEGMPSYDPDQEISITGTVVKIDEHTCRGASSGVHLWLATEAETLEICVGPAHFLKSEDFEIDPGDELEIVGSPLGDEDKILIAREIVLEDETLALRDERGLPNWRRSSGRRGRT